MSPSPRPSPLLQTKGTGTSCQCASCYLAMKVYGLHTKPIWYEKHTAHQKQGVFLFSSILETWGLTWIWISQPEASVQWGWNLRLCFSHLFLLSSQSRIAITFSVSWFACWLFYHCTSKKLVISPTSWFHQNPFILEQSILESSLFSLRTARP